MIESPGPVGMRQSGNESPSRNRDATPARLSSALGIGLVPAGTPPRWAAKWEPWTGVRVAGWRIRRMKTRWGTCNRRSPPHPADSALAKKPLFCIEYVVVHEMIHLVESNDLFREILDRVMPGGVSAPRS